jgi:hypothetical protein
MGYMKKGGWLHNVPNNDCAEEGGEGEDADLNRLLLKKGKKDVGYYCNLGPTGRELKEDHAFKALYTCGMVLCMKCYDK